MRLGNHETRYLRIAEANAQALVQLLKTMRKNRSLYLEDILSLDVFKIRLSYNPEDVLYDTFTIIHGVKTAKTAAKQNLFMYGSGTSGHTHRMNCHTEVMRGKIQGWWESGCLRTTKNIEYLPFGGGARRCLGAAFALYEMKVVLGTLLSAHRFSLVSDQPIRPVRRHVTLAPEGGVPLRYEGLVPAVPVAA